MPPPPRLGGGGGGGGGRIFFFFGKFRLAPSHAQNQRLLASGEVREPLHHASIAEACRTLTAPKALRPSRCACSTPTQIRSMSTSSARWSRSHAGCVFSLSPNIPASPELGRLSTTVVNAYIGPKVGGYVKSLNTRASAASAFAARSRLCAGWRRDDTGSHNRAAGGDDGVRHVVVGLLLRSAYCSQMDLPIHAYRGARLRVG